MRFVDLSTRFDPDFTVPQLPYSRDLLEMRLTENLDREGFQSTRFTLITHSGTHIDAPSHRFTREEKPDGIFNVEDIPLDWLFGDAVVMDIPKLESEPISARDFESAAPEVREGDIVLVHTGWGRFFGRSELKSWHHLYNNKPGLDVEGAEWLVKKKVRAYGQDTLGTQHPKYDVTLDANSREKELPRAKREPVHLLLKNDIVLIEHLTNLDKVAGRRIKVGFFPLPLVGVDGAPVRAVAFLDGLD